MPTKDTQKKQSTTLIFVIIAFVVLMIKFTFAGVGGIPAMSVSEFAIGYTAIMAVWLGREWRREHYNNPSRYSNDDLR